jgi:hypothetical protein
MGFPGEISRPPAFLEMNMSLLQYLTHTYIFPIPGWSPGYLPGVTELENTGEKKDAYRRLREKHNRPRSRERSFWRQRCKMGKYSPQWSGMEFSSKSNFLGV